MRVGGGIQSKEMRQLNVTRSRHAAYAAVAAPRVVDVPVRSVFPSASLSLAYVG